MLLEKWKQKLFQYYLIWSCRPAKVINHLQGSLDEDIQPVPIDCRRIRVAALQMELKLYKDPFAYCDEMHRHVKKAVAKGAQLVVFPEYNNLPLFGLLPGLEKNNELKNIEGDPNNVGSAISLADIFRYMSPVVEPLVNAIFSRLAAAYQLHIMAGSYALDDRGRVINRAFLYDPSGDLVGHQDKVHLLPNELAWKLSRGSSFSVYETALGNLALPVCMDATYYEPFRILEQKNADIILLPIANPEEYNYWLALRGIWPRVQESLLYGVKSALVGKIAGITFTGRAGIFAPLEITPNKNGILAEVEPHDREAIAVADLDLEALRELRREHPWRDNNPALYRRYLPDLYREAQGSKDE